MSGYRTYAKLNADGTIHSHMVTGGPVPPLYIEVVNEEDAILVQRSMNRALFDFATKRFTRKRTLRFVPTRRTFLADGVDVMVVNVVGETGPLRTLRIVIGDTPERVIDLPVGDPLEIVTRVPGPIGIRLRERLLIADPIVVMAVAPEGRT